MRLSNVHNTVEVIPPAPFEGGAEIRTISRLKSIGISCYFKQIQTVNYLGEYFTTHMKSSTKVLAALNGISILLVVVWNYWVGVNGLNGNTVASLSDELDNYFTPASYAFSIWGVIFLALLAHAVYQFKQGFISHRNSTFVSQMGPWLILANLGNCLWLWAWLTNKTGLSVIIMVTILISLIILILRLDIEVKEEKASVKHWVWWPIQLYAGWITVALIANMSAYLTKIGWSAVFDEMSWAVIMIIVAAVVNLLMLFYRNTLVFVAAGIWALIAIAIRHWDIYPSLQWAASLSAVILVGNVISRLIQNSKT